MQRPHSLSLSDAARCVPTMLLLLALSNVLIRRFQISVRMAGASNINTFILIPRKYTKIARELWKPRAILIYHEVVYILDLPIGKLIPRVIPLLLAKGIPCFESLPKV